MAFLVSWMMAAQRYHPLYHSVWPYTIVCASNENDSPITRNVKSSMIADIKPRYSNQSVCVALELVTFMDPRLRLLAVINHTWKDLWTTQITHFRYGDIRSTPSIRYIEGLNNMRYQSYRYIVPPLLIWYVCFILCIECIGNLLSFCSIIWRRCRILLGWCQWQDPGHP